LEASRDVSVPWGTIDTFPERICALNPVIVAAGGGAATDLFANIFGKVSGIACSKVTSSESKTIDAKGLVAERTIDNTVSSLPFNSPQILALNIAERRLRP
jgi:hypothetical protein